MSSKNYSKKIVKKENQKKTRKTNSRVIINQELYKNNTISLEEHAKPRELELKKHFLNLILILLIICLILNLISVSQKNTNRKTNVNSKKTENIVFLGDSITWMYDLNKYYKKHFTVNSGISGDSTEEILENMHDRIYKYNPTKVIILIGTNDISRKKSSDQISQNIEKIVTRIRENRPKCKIYVESIYPINNTAHKKINREMLKNRNNKKIQEVNKKIEKLCLENKVQYINIYGKITDKKGNLKLDYTKDGLHLNIKGYKKVTENLENYLI